MILDKTYGHAAYGCAICCGYEYPFMEYKPLYVVTDGYGDQYVEAGDSCGGGTQVITGDFPTWWTGNTAIATASGHQIYGVAPGTTSHYAQSNPMYWGLKEYYPTCPVSQQEPSAPTNVAPTISSISPAQGSVGAGTQVTITGTGFASGASVSAGPNISVSGVSVSSSTEIAAKFTPTNSSSAGGNQAVTVTVAGQPSNSKNFFDQVPTSLSIVAGTDSTSPEASCSAGSFGTGCGVTRSFTYQVNDQNGNSIQTAGLEVWDAIATTSPNNLSISGYNTTCSPSNTGPCGVTTNSSGQFEEQPGLSVCSTVCRVNNACTKAGQTNATQTVYVGPASIVQQLVYYCDHITVNGN